MFIPLFFTSKVLIISKQKEKKSKLFLSTRNPHSCSHCECSRNRTDPQNLATGAWGAILHKNKKDSDFSET